MEKVNCENCVNNETDVCEKCSVYTNPSGCCSCHINAPCGMCENNKFEEK